MAEVYVFSLFVAVFMTTSVYSVLNFFSGRSSEDVQMRHRLEELTDKHHHSGIDAQATFSSIAGLNRALKRQRFSQKLHQLLVLSGWTMPVSVFLMLDCLWGGLCYLITRLITENDIAGIVVGVIMAAIPYWMLVIRRRRYVDRFTVAFPDALMLLKSAIKAGQGIQPAFQMVAQEGPQPVAGEFQRVVQEMELGSQLNEALNELYKRIHTVDLRIFVLGVFIQHEVGGNLGELFGHIEKTIRDRLSMFQEIKVLSAQGKMTGLVLMILPIALASIILMINPTYFDPIVDTEFGKKLLWLAFGLQVIGCIVIRKMTYFKIV